MDAPTLVARRELIAWGLSSSDIAGSVTAGLLVRLRPGVFAFGEAWAGATAEERIVARARALAAVSKHPPLFSHETAAAIHGLPLLWPDPSRVHVILDAARAGAAGGVVRHRGQIGPSEVVVIDGLRCASLIRTVADLARTATFERAVTVTDAALRRSCMVNRSAYEHAGAAEFRRNALAVAGASAHGRSRAERVLDFADGRAERPGESLSRIRLAEIGFRRVSLQVPVPAPAPGASYFVDFGLEDVAAFGEFDGRIKYHDGRMLVGRSSDDVFDEEKRREDWIRGTTGRAMVRWGWSHVKTAQALAERLAAFSIRPPC